MMHNETVLKISNVTKTYKNTTAVDNVNMTIKKGDIYGLIGKNGAGKTTLLRLVAALTFADRGEIELFGQTTEVGLQEARNRMGSVIEMPALYPNLTAVQNLEYYQHVKGIPDKAVIQAKLELVGLTDTGKKKFKDFSLGMKQRLGIALALLNNPYFIILDEPVNGLDPAGIVEMREFLKKLNEEHRITILISSHLLTELSMIATRYGFIDHGRLIKEITDEQLQEECKQSLVVTVDDTKKATSILETVLGVTEFKVVSEAEIRIYDHLDDTSEVNYQLVAGGVRVLNIVQIDDSLEDYFLSLIGGGNDHV